MKRIILGSVWLLIGCKAFTGSGGLSNYETSLSIARLHMNAGEHYQAKKLTQAILDESPEDPEAQKLMGQIISQEIELHREVFEEVKAPEEFNSHEKKDEVKTWIERSEALLELGQYEKAVAAAEKVFLYDPDNLQASLLTDQIRQEAFKKGRRGQALHQAMARDEVSRRVDRYRQTAQEMIESERWGAAKHAVQKILLLSPEDPEGLRLQQTILSHQSQPLS